MVFSVFTRPLFVKHPQTAKAKDLFYCRPLTNYTKDEAWYSEQPREKHTISDVIKKFCEQVGIEGKFTNHSQRASGATTLFSLMLQKKLFKNSLATDLSKHSDSIRKLQVNTKGSCL